MIVHGSLATLLAALLATQTPTTAPAAPAKDAPVKEAPVKEAPSEPRVDPRLDPALGPLDQADPLAGCKVGVDALKNNLVTCGMVKASVRRDVKPAAQALAFKGAENGLRAALPDANVKVTVVDAPIAVGDRVVPGKVVRAERGGALVATLEMAIVGEVMLQCFSERSGRAPRWERCRTLLGALLASDPAPGEHPLAVWGVALPHAGTCTLWARNRVMCPTGEDLFWWQESFHARPAEEIAAMKRELAAQGTALEHAVRKARLAGEDATCEIAELSKRGAIDAVLRDCGNAERVLACNSRERAVPALCAPLLSIAP